MGKPIEGNVVDVFTGEIFPGRISHRDGVITAVERIGGTFKGFLIPGLIDAHIHIDSSLLCPSRFAEAVVPMGTTAVVTDPHEIANVLGIRGIAYMRQDAATVPLRVYFTAPSCVPATPFETSGAVLGPGEIADLLGYDDFVALGEMMNYPGAIAEDPDVMAKIRAAHAAGKPVDGHAPMLLGAGLRKYASLGISTDHECTGSAEALEKHSLGMRIMVRQGSAAKDLPALAPFAREHYFILVSDDREPSDLLNGHQNASLAEAVALGIDPIHALRAATLRPAEHYRLPLGAIAAGRKADIVKVGDLSSFSVAEVWIGGERAAANGAPAFRARPMEIGGAIFIKPKSPSDFGVPAGGKKATVRVIGIVRDELVTESGTAVLSVKNGLATADPARDILLLSVVNRYKDVPPACGFVRGLGLKEGAIATSVAHDSHNLIVAGTNPADMAGAVDTLIRESGGFCVYAGGKATVLPLRVAGLMSPEPAREVQRRLARLESRARESGCVLDRPFITLSFLSLLVIPRLKLGDRGLFDVDAFRFTDVVVK